MLSTSALIMLDFTSRRSLKIMLKRLCELANTMSDPVICSGPLLAYRGDEIHSRLLSLNGWMSKWCPQNNVGFIDNWTSFWGRPDLLKRDGLHQGCAQTFCGKWKKWKKGHFSYLFIFFLNKTLNILGMCDIDKKCINIFWDFIDNDRQYFADCVIVLIS